MRAVFIAALNGSSRKEATHTLLSSIAINSVSAPFYFTIQIPLLSLCA
jgi:hypothetical protein